MLQPYDNLFPVLQRRAHAFEMEKKNKRGSATINWFKSASVDSAKFGFEAPTTQTSSDSLGATSEAQLSYAERHWRWPHTDPLSATSVGSSNRTVYPFLPLFSTGAPNQRTQSRDNRISESRFPPPDHLLIPMRHSFEHGSPTNRESWSASRSTTRTDQQTNPSSTSQGRPPKHSYASHVSHPAPSCFEAPTTE